MPMGPISRSLLFVPGDRPERFQKAANAGAHQIILDLEDAVAPDAKDAARRHVEQWLEQGNCAAVRVNAVDTPWYERDIQMLRAWPDVVVMLPKADDQSLACTIDQLPSHQFVALLETVTGYVRLHQLCAVKGLSRIAFGSIDFSVESRVADVGEVLTAVRVQIALASAYAGLLPPIDGVSLELNDHQIMLSSAEKGRDLGFGGKLCIHPRQVAAVNAAYQPTAQQVQWAQRVVDAFELSGGAATTLDGKMIDKPVVLGARQVLEEHAARI